MLNFSRALLIEETNCYLSLYKRNVIYLNRNLEECWFGLWKCLLQRKSLNYKNFGSKLKKLRNNLTSKFKVYVNEDHLKIVLGGSCTRERLKKKDNYIVKVGHCDEVIISYC
jgi:hypothetical protein